MKKWMIFRSEATNHYYLYNGIAVVDFTPGEPKIPWDMYDRSTVALLDAALNSARTKLMVTYNTKVRYPIVARGIFIED